MKSASTRVACCIARSGAGSSPATAGHCMRIFRKEWVSGLLAGSMVFLATQSIWGIEVGCTPEWWRDVIPVRHTDAEWIEMLVAAKHTHDPPDCLDVAVGALAVQLEMLDPSNADSRFRTIAKGVDGTP